MNVRRKLEDLARVELLEKAKKDFQRMIRAEAGAYHGPVLICAEHGIKEVFSPLGQCVCVTCGAIHPWKGTNKLDTGHAIAGRRQSVVFDERQAAPQCVACNRYHGGYPDRFQRLILHVYGKAVLAKLLKDHATNSLTWGKPWLLRKIAECRQRTKAAVLIMGSHPTKPS